MDVTIRPKIAWIPQREKFANEFPIVVDPTETIRSLAEKAELKLPPQIKQADDPAGSASEIRMDVQFVKFIGIPRALSSILKILHSQRLQPVNVHQILVLLIEHRTSLIRLAGMDGGQHLDFHAVALGSLQKDGVPVLSIKDGPPRLSMLPEDTPWTSSYKFPVVHLRPLQAD